jgi:hypothetical protein
MNTYGRVGVQTSALVWGEWSASLLGRFTLGYPLDKRLGELHSLSGRRREETNLTPTGTRTPTPLPSSPETVLKSKKSIYKLHWFYDVLYNGRCYMLVHGQRKQRSCDWKCSVCRNWVSFRVFVVQLQLLSPKLAALLSDPLCSSSWMIGAHSGVFDLPTGTSGAAGCPEVLRVAFLSPWS